MLIWHTDYETDSGFVCDWDNELRDIVKSWKNPNKIIQLKLEVY